jgi:hypothetical protein
MKSSRVRFASLSEKRGKQEVSFGPADSFDPFIQVVQSNFC